MISCRRRWYLVVLSLVVTAAACYFLAGVVKPQYESAASVVLIPPKSVDDPTINRYLGLGGLSGSVDVLARSMGSDGTARALHKQAPLAKYAVDPDATTSAPILLVTATSKDPAQVQVMLSAALLRLPENLASLQDQLSIAPASQIIAQTVAKSAKPKANEKPRLRILGAVAAGLIFLLAIMIAALDGLLLRRSARAEAVMIPPDPTWLPIEERATAFVEPPPTRAEAAPQEVAGPDDLPEAKDEFGDRHDSDLHSRPEPVPVVRRTAAKASTDSSRPANGTRAAKVAAARSQAGRTGGQGD